jgi:rod shape-determining protein MreC
VPGRTRTNPTIMFVVLVLVSFVLMTFDVQSRGSDDLLSRFRSGAASLFGPVQAATDAVVDPVAGFLDGVVSLATLRERNDKLVDQVEELNAEVAALKVLEVENESLRRLLNLREEVGIEAPTLLAEVQGSGDDGSLTVDKGRSDGVLLGYPVLSEAGNLIGRVVAVAENQSTIRLITESVDVIEVTTPQGLRGAVSGLGRAGELRYDVYEGAQAVPPETVLSTAGTNGYPPGLPVAEVGAALIEPIGDQIVDARVVPVADFGRIPRFVAIVQVPSDPMPTEGEGTTDVPAGDDGAPNEQGGGDSGAEDQP